MMWPRIINANWIVGTWGLQNMKTNIIYSFFEKLRGTEILKIYEHLKKTEKYTREQLDKYQFEKLHKLLLHVKDNVPFYIDYFKKNNLSIHDFKSLNDINLLPVIEKKTMREMFKSGEIISKNKDTFNPIPNQTGGSTGIPLQLLIGGQARNFQGAAVLRYYDWMGGYCLGDQKFAVLWGDMRVKSLKERLSDELKMVLTKRRAYSCFAMDKALIASHHKKLLRFDPEFLRGYAFAVYLLAQFQRENSVNSKLSFKAVSTTTEKITMKQRQVIEEEFGCKTFDQYGCGEILMIAGECAAHDGMHVTEEHVIVETNENNEFIITDLDNYAMPFLRYKNGDMGEVSDEPCQCGMAHKRIKNLTGRVDDTIILKNGKVINSSFFAVLFEYMENVSAFQVYYYNSKKMDINIVPDVGFDTGDEKYIRDKVLMAFGQNQAFTLNFVNEINQAKNGKTKFVNICKAS